jgi:hypothetical protein
MSRSSASAHAIWRFSPQRFLEALTAVADAPEKRRSPDLIGIDVSDGRFRSPPALFIPFLIAGLIAALFLVGLRIDILRMRYATAEALAQEEVLLAEKRTLTVEMRRLRDPSLLAGHAREMGFVHPENIIDLSTATTASGQSQAAERPVEQRP